jgi:hypothetical protein
VKEVLERIESNAKTSSNEPRMVRTMQVGDIVRQGDIYIERIAILPKPSEISKRGDRQLALGNTEGSRHVCTRGPALYDLVRRTALQGPIIDAPKRFHVTHPEHAHVSLPSGTYAVTYQRDFGEEQLAAVRD